jgi:glycosyltransferase involved in cell wall biosynthesis
MTGSASASGRTSGLVSVITIFLDAAAFLDEAIASVIAQTYPAWELILVDDGSTDASVAIARRWSGAHPDRVRILAHPDGGNHGMSASRRLGVDAARGEFLAFLDADDLFLPDKLERQVAILRAHPEVAMVFGPSLHWYGWTGRPDDAARDVPRRLGVEPDRTVAPPTLALAYLDHRADTPATCAVLIRGTTIERLDGFVPAFRGLYEDQVFIYQVVLGSTVYVEGTAHDRYRRHPAAYCEVRIRNGTHADDDRPTVARGAFLSWLDGYVRRHMPEDEGVRRRLDRELWPYRHPRLARWRGRALSVLRSGPLRPARRLARSTGLVRPGRSR